MIEKDEFLKNNIVESEKAFTKLYGNKLNILKVLFYLGHITYIFPFLALYFLLSNLDDTNLILDYLLLPLSLLVSGMFFIVYRDVILSKIEQIKKIYVDFSKNVLQIVLEREPFILYARGFQEERDLGNRNGSWSENLFDKYYWLGVNNAVAAEMDKLYSFSYIPHELEDIIHETNYELIGLGHIGLEREIKPIKLLFCKNSIWKNVFNELADRANLILVNTLERDGSHNLKLGEGLEQEIDIILKKNELLSKTLIIYNDKKSNETLEDKRLNKIIQASKWSSAYKMHDNEGEFTGPIGFLPKEFIRIIVNSQ